MLSLAFGIAVLVIVSVIFAKALPKNGQKYRFADTAWEPYVAVALTAGVALGIACVLQGIFTPMAA